MDRNKYVVQCRKVLNVSLSARRAWIEMIKYTWPLLIGPSLSARRAWIEIEQLIYLVRGQRRRSPQGERG